MRKNYRHNCQVVALDVLDWDCFLLESVLNMNNEFEFKVIIVCNGFIFGKFYRCV